MSLDYVTRVLPLIRHTFVHLCPQINDKSLETHVIGQKRAGKSGKVGPQHDKYDIPVGCKT